MDANGREYNPRCGTIAGAPLPCHTGSPRPQCGRLTLRVRLFPLSRNLSLSPGLASNRLTGGQGANAELGPLERRRPRRRLWPLDHIAFPQNRSRSLSRSSAQPAIPIPGFPLERRARTRRGMLVGQRRNRRNIGRKKHRNTPRPVGHPPSPGLRRTGSLSRGDDG